MLELKEISRTDGFMAWENFPFPASETEIDPDGISYEIMRFSDAQKMTDQLAGQIFASGKKFDAVVYPLRGGFYPGVKIAEMIHCPVYPIGLRLYQGIQAKDEVNQQKVELYKPLPTNVDFSGKRILAVDDVNHTSNSLEALETHLKEKEVACLAVAVLHEKPAYAKKKADYVVRQTDAWIVYPWEHIGDELHQRWEFFAEKFPVWMLRDDRRGTNWSGCLERSLQIGFKPEELPRLNSDNFFNRLYANLQERKRQINKKATFSDKELIALLR
jgi:hypoxanthine phosphoribosyltransferase